MLDISNPQRLHDGIPAMRDRTDADHLLGIGRNFLRGLRCLLIRFDLTPGIKSIKIWFSSSISSSLNDLLENGFLYSCTINLRSFSFGFHGPMK